ncbi:MAG: hypothetical protein AAF436_00820 [Myxococcota bacterium]
MISAPGKALLCGEYGVLEGGTAVVAAVGRRLRVEREPPSTAYHRPGPEAVAATAASEREFGKITPPLRFDASALFRDGKKLGLGSSAAAAVGAAAAVAVARGFDLDEPGIRDRVFAAALEGHRAVAPEGSGVDVAASTYGGFLEFRIGEDAVVDASPVRGPASLAPALVWTASPVRTSDLVSRVKALQVRDASRYARLMASLVELGSAFARAFREGDVRSVIRCAAQYHEAMRGLGNHTGAPIVTRELDAVAEWAALEGGAAKPCGAGGGDAAVAFFSDPGARASFLERCSGHGLVPIDLPWGVPGVRADEPRRRDYGDDVSAGRAASSR